MRLFCLILAHALFIPFHFCQSTGQPSKLQNEQSIFIDNINYINVENGDIIELQDILIIDGLISEISEHIDPPADVVKLKGAGLWLMPGMIDAHIHLFQSGGLYTRPDAIDLRSIRPYDQEVQWLKDNASQIMKSYLRLGITSIIDVGGPMHNYTIRDNYKGSLLHPNLFVTGPLISTYQPKELNVTDPPIIRVGTTDEARELVRKQLPFQPDFIKVWYIALPSMSANTSYELVEATIDESHSHGLEVAVHATQLNTAKLAIRAGADILVHSVTGPIDEEFVDMLIEHEITYIPTLNVHGNYDIAFANHKVFSQQDLSVVSPFIIESLIGVEQLKHPTMLDEKEYAQTMMSRVKEQDVIRRDNLKLLASRKVRIASGTDAGNIGTLHASSFYDELESMQLSGMTNHQIIKSSTIEGARSIGRDNLIGSVDKGKMADLIILNDNPLEELSALKNIHSIIKNGHLVEIDKLHVDSPEELVQKQLNAYNIQDIDAFISPYSDSVKVYVFPNEFLYQGKEMMKKNYEGFFKNTPGLHCKLVNRIVLENTVIDQEFVSGLNNDQSMRAVAIYKIKHGKIQEVYFDRGN